MMCMYKLIHVFVCGHHRAPSLICCISEYFNDSRMVAELQRVTSERLIADLLQVVGTLYNTVSLTVTC